MTEHRHYSGLDLAPLLRQVRDELGSDAEIIRAERIRTGGLAGFFAREHYEVVAKRLEVEPPAPVEVPAPSAAKPGPAVERSAVEPIVGEPIVGEPIADEPIAGPSPAEPAMSDAAVTAGGAGRSIQAALLDRADRVSTEELLARVAETHSAEWGSESFQSILGRAMVDAVGPSVDMTSGEERRREPSPIDLGPHRPDESINGLRLEPVRPDENVIDPAPQPSPGEPRAEAEDAGQTDGEPDSDQSIEAAGHDGWQGQLHGHPAPPWAGDVPPPWGPPWLPGWAPWTINGWPGPPPGDPTWGPAPHLRCANCADPVVADGYDDVGAPTLDEGTNETPDADDPWSELRQEINDVRLRLDDIIGTIRQATADESFGAEQGPSDNGRENDGETASDDRKDSRRNGRSGR